MLIFLAPKKNPHPLKPLTDLCHARWQGARTSLTPWTTLVCHQELLGSILRCSERWHKSLHWTLFMDHTVVCVGERNFFAAAALSGLISEKRFLSFTANLPVLTHSNCCLKNNCVLVPFRQYFAIIISVLRRHLRTNFHLTRVIQQGTFELISFSLPPHFSARQKKTLWRVKKKKPLFFLSRDGPGLC